ncbi:MAG: radical SAM protein [Nitrospirota bacterium]
MSKIVLVNPPLSLEERYGVFSTAGNTMPSLGLCHLAAVVKRANFEVIIIEASSLNLSYDETLSQILAVSPEYVGLTATTCSIHNAGKLARMIKDKKKGIKIIIGGPHVTAIPEETMKRFPAFDIGVLGEGEETIKEILASNGDLSGIKGLIVPTEAGFHLAGKRDFIKNLDELPFPAWELLKDFPSIYRPAAFRFKRLPAVSLVTSRGCPNQCIFCDRAVFGNKCRAFSAEYILELIKDLQARFGIKEILFEDDTLTMFKKRLISICENILEENIDLSWTCLGRVDMVDLAMLKLMKKAGCWQISYGIESGSQRILDFIHKKISLDQVLNAVELSKKAGIMTKGFFILGHPTETKESIQTTIDFAKKIRIDDISVSLLTPFPGSELYEIAGKFGRFEDDWSKMNLLQSVFIPDGFTAEEIEGYYKKILKEFYLRPSIIFSYLCRMKQNPATAWRIGKAGMSLLKRIRR